MTVLGKILAILNLVLSLAVGAFIVMTYVARTNWHAAYDKMQKYAEVYKLDAEAFKGEMDKAKGERAKTEEEFTKYRAAADKEKQDLNAQVRAREEMVKHKAEENARLVAAQTAAVEELNRRKNEVDYLKKLIGDRDTQLVRAQKQVNDMRDAMVEAQINYNQEHERNERLLQENERLAQNVQHTRQVANTTSLRSEAPKKNPPAEDIAASVKQVDPQSGLVTLSVGSDAGLSKGHTMEAYRLNPTPLYLGTVQILDVRPNEAVARPLDRTRPIKVGDQVSSNIMRQRG